MSEQILQFRTAVFGGFQKQDVLAYLERNAKDHAEKLSALRKELAEEKQARTEDGETLTALKERIAALEEENRQLTESLSGQKAALAQRDGERAELDRALAETRAQVEKLAPAAAAFEAVREHSAMIEQEAQSRARQMEEEGRKKAEKLQEEAAAWYTRMQETYDRLRTDVDAIVGHAAQELEGAVAGLSGISESFGGYDAALAGLKEQISALGKGETGTSAAEPVPGPAGEPPVPTEE